jgi:hypothetical protein
MRSTAHPAPLWLLVWGYFCVFGSALFTAHEIWEETFWTWRDGPHILVWSTLHSRRFFLLPFPLMLVPWLAAVLVAILYSLAKRRRVSRALCVTFVAGAAVLAIDNLPYGLWQRWFADRLANGPHAAEFLVFAATQGDLGTVKEFLARGVAMESRDWEGKTGLHVAAAHGQMEVLNYLLSRSADPNAIDRFGDSPLETATSEKQSQAVQLLETRGAKRIRGDDEHRRKAWEEVAHEDFGTRFHFLCNWCSAATSATR